MVAYLARRVRVAFDLGFLAALLALVGQMALGAVVLPDTATAAEQIAALDSASILCDGSPASGDNGAPLHRHHAADLALCPLSVALALPAVVLTPSPALPQPAVVLIAGIGERPPARGPPPPTAHVGTPRAPPSSLA